MPHTLGRDNKKESTFCCAAESMALEASARVAVTNAIENKEDLGRMLGIACQAQRLSPTSSAVGSLPRSCLLTIARVSSSGFMKPSCTPLLRRHVISLYKEQGC